MLTKKILFITLICSLIISCGEKKAKTEVQPQEEEIAPVVFVSNYPLAFFVESIAGTQVEILSYYESVPEPTAWEPNEEQINALQQADLVLLNGASFEPWAMMLSLPQSRLVVTTDASKDQLIAEKQTMSHSHGPEGEHEHTVSAYTTWLDFNLANAQAKSVLDALSRLQPEKSAEYEANYKVLSNQLMALDQKMSTTGQAWKGSNLAFSHPVYQYLQNAYGIKGSSFHWEPGIVPDKKQWHDFRHEQGHHPFAHMVWEAQPLKETVDQLSTRGVDIIVFNPCTKAPEKGDFLSVMESNIQNIQRTIQ